MRTISTAAIAAVALLAAASTTNAQTFLMNNNNPEVTCTGTFVDSGDVGANYLANELFTKTFSPTVGTDKLVFNFTLFDTESCCDFLSIYDGNSTGAPLIGTFSGTTGPGIVVSSAVDGTLTFEWDSDGSVQDVGWEAAISCFTPGAGGACCLNTGMCTAATDMNDCEVTQGGTYQGDGTDCAFVTCPQPCTTCNTPTALPYSETFEAGFGLWTQNADDDDDWTRDSGGTGSTGTGPSVDHTLGTAAGFYLYTEATGNAPGDRYILDGPCFDLTGTATPEFSFWYHMLNTSTAGDMGTLSVEISTDDCLNYTEEFSVTGNQGDVWLNGVIDLAAYVGQTINVRFIGTRGNDFESDMAIDDIVVLDTSAAVTGACCFLDGSCTDVDSTDCATAGGTYRGDLTSCASGICAGACCLDNDECEDTSEASCNNAGGIYLGDTTQCGVDPCPPPGDICVSAVPVGSGTTILTNAGNTQDDPDPSCTSSGALDVWAVYTVEQNGSLLIDTCGTFLDGTNPTQIDTIAAAYDGACGGPQLDCDDDCAGTTDPSQATCHGEGQTSPPTGSTRDSCLCIDSVTIGQLIYIQIQDFGGTDTGNITLTITPDGCPPPTGRCCQADGSCTIEGETDCGNLGGIYGGDATDCTVSCFGACCLPANGGCVSETEASCSNAGGSYGGDESECFTYDIGTGTSNGGIICEGSCTDLTILRSSPAQAAAIDITFDNDIATQDGLSGSCGAGGALNMHNDAIFRYLAISDTSGPCDVTITVTPTGYDAVLVVRSACDGAELACSDVGATGGAESVTIPGYGPGNLFIQVGDFGTTEGGGATQLQVDCSTATGACCIGGGCEILTAGDCLLAGGTYKGANTDCASSCFGACCANNGSCDSVTEVSCNADGGSYQGDGVSCTPNPCPQPPAGDTCDTAVEVTCGTGTITGLTVDLANADHTLIAAGSCTGFDADGPEIVFTFTPATDVLVDTGMINVVGFDATFYVVTDCLDTNGTCVAGDDSGGAEEVSFTATAGTTYFLITDSWTDAPALGTSFDFYINCTTACGTCPGDVNGDSLIDGLDIQSFTNCYLANFGGMPADPCGCADADESGTIDALDIDAFVALVLNGGVCNPGACCYLDGGSATCIVTDEAGCTLLGGDFTLGGDCTGDPCPDGRCCSNGGLTCDDVPELECIALGGSWSAGLDCLGSPCPVTPPNDGCGGAIAAFDGANPVNLTNATNSGLASCGDFPFGGPANQEVNNDLWYSYVATCTGTLFVDTCGNAFDTRLAVYDVDCATIIGGTLPVECNDDHGNATEADTGNTCADGLSASLSIPVSSGNTYIIRVGSFSTASQTAAFDLNIACVAGGSGACCIQATGMCVDVTGGDSECMGLGGTYQGDGTTCATTICGGACCLANGTCVDAATGSDCEDNIGGTYQGNGTECASTNCPQPPPPNDDCANATVVFTGSNAGGNNCGASAIDDKEATCQANSGLDVYYVWTADCTGQATIDTEGSVFGPSNDTVLSVYETSCGNPTELACDDDDGTGLLSTLSFACTSGTDYVIRVAGFGANCGEITLNIACVSGGACCLPNATCAPAADASDCVDNLGGVYQGDFTDCGSIVCGGACCLANGSCTQAVDASDCIDNLGGSIFYGDGTSCSDPFVICPGPGECLHTITLFDTFGDGWIGSAGPDAAIEVFVNGVSAFGGPITLPDQGQVNVPVQGSANFAAATGDVITTTYFAGDAFNDENSWEITDGGGAVICEDLGSGTGPDPTVMRACPSTANCP